MGESNNSLVLEICKRTVVLKSIPISVEGKNCVEQSIFSIVNYVSTKYSHDFLLSLDMPLRQYTKNEVQMGRATIFFPKKNVHDQFVRDLHYEFDKTTAVPPLNILRALKSRGRIWNVFVNDSCESTSLNDSLNDAVQTAYSTPKRYFKILQRQQPSSTQEIIEDECAVSDDNPFVSRLLSQLDL